MSASISSAPILYSMNRGSTCVAVVLVCFFAAAFTSHAQPCALDTNFNSGLPAGAIIYAVTTQTNGQMLIGGIFQSINGTDRFNIARLNPAGSLDESFDAGTVADNGYISAITVQNDGKILIGGAFGSTSGTGTPYLTRLNTNGT